MCWKLGKTLEDVKVEAIVAALVRADGNKTKAAKLLGVSRTGLVYMVNTYNLRIFKGDYRQNREPPA